MTTDTPGAATRTTAERHYDAIVVGSGFGGSVTAYRLAEAGKRVLVLERGKAYPLGSFPRSPYAFKRSFWDPSQGLYGMYHVWSFDNIGAVVSSALGGGSIIYANVLIRKDPEWFVREDVNAGGFEYWPVTREDLDPHYDRVEKMLNAQAYPVAHPPYDTTPRTVAFRDGARRLGWEPYQPKLAVTFSNPGAPPVPGETIVEEHANLHGQTRRTCILVGECDIGCQVGAKNTLDFNYLSAAKRLGAEIQTLTEVKTFAPRDRGWEVGFVRHDLDREGTPMDTGRLPLETITADRLVLGAGTLGTTFLLLRNLPRLPRLLGSRFNGNGDLMTIVRNPRRRVDGRWVRTVIDPGRGPVITSAIRFPDEGGGRRGFYVQDIGFPDFVSWMLQVVETPGALWRFRSTAIRLLRRLLGRQRETDLSAEISELFGDPTSIGLLPLAGMGRDVPDGWLRLRGELLNSDWRIDRSSEYFERVRATHRQLANALDGDFNDNITWSFGQRVITAHPLGGAPMGRNESEGVVSPDGEVFGYPGLYVVDGSMMPGPVGPNPSLTIAALADRFADRMIETGGG